jgi:hypothetical protein
MQPSPIAETAGPVRPRFRVSMAVIVTDALTDFNSCHSVVRSNVNCGWVRRRGIGESAVLVEFLGLRRSNSTIVDFLGI